MPRRVECFAISGLGWIFTAAGVKALDRLHDAISPVWDCTFSYHTGWEAIADGIIARQERFRDEPVVCLIGHSYGALRCQQIASRLHSHGIKTDYVAGIDPTALPPGHPPMVIPRSVLEVDEFHSMKWFFNFPYAARKRDPEGFAGGMYLYSPEVDHTVHKINTGHIATARDPLTVETIVNRVKELTQ